MRDWSFGFLCENFGRGWWICLPVGLLTWRNVLLLAFSGARNCEVSDIDLFVWEISSTDLQFR